MNYKIAGVILFLTMLFTFASGCIVAVTTVAPGYGVTPTYYNNGVGSSASVEITSNQITKDAAGNAVGLVTIKNVSNVTAGLVAIDAKFYSSQNVLVYSAQDSIMNLQPGGTWDFTFSTSVSYNVARTLQVQATATSSAGGF
jgi:hypothetical protein